VLATAGCRTSFATVAGAVPLHVPEAAGPCLTNPVSEAALVQEMVKPLFRTFVMRMFSGDAEVAAVGIAEGATAGTDASARVALPENAA